MTENNTKPPLRSIGVGIILAAFGFAVAKLPPPVGPYGWLILAVGLAVVVLAGAVSLHRWRATAGKLGFWAWRSRRSAGVASVWSIMRSNLRIRSKSTTLRPSLGPASRIRRLFLPIRQYAFLMARVGFLNVWSAGEDVTLRVGGPRMGKTAELACQIVDAPGAVVATSTSPDIVLLTAPIRQARGRIHMFNPEGLGGWSSTLKWSPLAGCRSASIAQKRAADMIPTAADASGERWDVQARDNLSVLMHAAALADLSMRDVLRWISDPKPETSGRQVDRALERSPEAVAMKLAAAQFFGMNDRTKTSITATMRPALRWLLDLRSAALGDPATEESADIATLLGQGDTIYLLGEEDGVVGPLVAALTAEIARSARMAASALPNGRLDPPLTIALDEAARICRVPLPDWTADMGKRGIALHISVQSRVQLIENWGEAGGRAILGNVATLMVFGGCLDEADLRAWSLLAGDREVPSIVRDSAGKVTQQAVRVEPVMSPSSISELPEFVAMVKRKGIRGIMIGKTPVAWGRRDIARSIRRNPWTPVTETSYQHADEEVEV